MPLCRAVAIAIFVVVVYRYHGPAVAVSGVAKFRVEKLNFVWAKAEHSELAADDGRLLKRLQVSITKTSIFLFLIHNELPFLFRFR